MKALGWVVAVALLWLAWAAPRAAVDEATARTVVQVAYALAFVVLLGFHARQATTPEAG